METQDKREDLLEKIAQAPEKPGVYFFRSKLGELLYVGKAKVLRRRLGSYFRQEGGGGQSTRIQWLVRLVETIEWEVTANESEALFLEASWIQKAQPRFNVRLKDDRTYPALQLQLGNHPFPRLEWSRRRRGQKEHRGRWFGPFPLSQEAREFRRAVAQFFQLRECSDAVFRNRQRPCVLYDVGQCSGPCVGKVSQAEYQKQVEQVVRVLEGQSQGWEADLLHKREAAAQAEQFEQAAVYRDQLKLVEKMRRLAEEREEFFWEDSELFHKQQKKQEQEAAGPLLERLKQKWKLTRVPHRIECYDISNFQSEAPVASRVVLTEGVLDRSAYRHYHLKTPGPNDFAMLEEVLERRLGSDELLPDLILLDGGKGQLRKVWDLFQSVLKKQPLPDLRGLAKARSAKGTAERLYAPEESEPGVLSDQDPADCLLLKLRDEAHRFAIQFHRKVFQKKRYALKKS